MSRKTGLNSSEINKVSKLINEFYRREGRHELPWRKTRDPYSILVSEIMLQQTQAERVIPYYNRFLKVFPTIKALAQVPLSNVLKEWQGLGYNRRGKMLLQCAQEITEYHKGKVPRSRNDLEALSGIGPYTAGAIRAFAYNEPDIFIETNIRSVLIFHFFPRSQSVSDARLLPILSALTAMQKSPREWYAALMDYGSYLKKQFPNPSRRSKHHVRQQKFEGSLRQMRGEIVRALANGTTLSYLKNDPRFTSAFLALKKEGMVVESGSKWKLAS